MPVDPHPEIPEEIGARSHHDDAARRRQIRQRRLSRPPAACTASASRWSTRCPSALEVEVARGQTLYRQAFERGKPIGQLETVGKAPNRRGTKVRFQPDPQIFGEDARFEPARAVQDGALEGLSVRRRRNPLALRARSLIADRQDVPPRRCSTSPAASRTIWPPTSRARNWSPSRSSPARSKSPASTARSNGRSPGSRDDDGFVHSYCNTIPTPDGGTHEAGLRAALLRGLKDHAERIGQASAPRAHHRRRDGRLRGADLGLHPRAGVPGPEQGPAA